MLTTQSIEPQTSVEVRQNQNTRSRAVVLNDQICFNWWGKDYSDINRSGDKDIFLKNKSYNSKYQSNNRIKVINNC